MDAIEKFIHRNSHRFDKGYPNADNPKEMQLLKEMLDDFIAEASKSLGDNQMFNDAIKKQLNVDDVPLAQGNYMVEFGKLTIGAADQKIFKELYNVTPTQTIGNGEIALYWLFSPNADENHGGSAADLMLNGVPVEVKSYPSHNTKIKLGKFASDTETKSTITKIFGVANALGIEKLVGRGKSQKTQDYVTEIGFTTEDIYQSYLKVVEIRLGLNALPAEYKPEGSIFNLLEKQIESVVPTGMPGTAQDQAENLTKALVINFITTKLGKKPGEDGGFVCNISSKNPLDIMMFKIPDAAALAVKMKNKTLAQLNDLVSIVSGEILLNYNLIQD